MAEEGVGEAVVVGAPIEAKTPETAKAAAVVTPTPLEIIVADQHHHTNRNLIRKVKEPHLTSLTTRAAATGPPDAKRPTAAIR